MLKFIFYLLTLTHFAFASTDANAASKKEGSGAPPPMLVSTTAILSGKAEPTANFVGTIFFSRTAKVAAEVDGKVLQVYIEDGDAVALGDRLAQLDDDLLVTQIRGTQAAFEQNQVDLDQANKDYDRISVLYEQDSIAMSEYESYNNRVNRLKKQAIILEARLDRLLLEQKKKIVRAPFNGLVVENLVEKGEWISAGDTVATVADNRSFEAQVDIPAKIISFLEPGEEISVSVAGRQVPGRFQTIIPRGDISTRTFVAKFVLQPEKGLIEGMQAHVSLPIAEPNESLLVPRDAILTSGSSASVFISENGIARQVLVKITGYLGDQVGVESDTLEANQQVIIKGNERIRDGQPIRTE